MTHRTRAFDNNIDTTRETRRMKRIWLESYQPGVPYEVDAQAYASLNDLFEKCCDRFSDMSRSPALAAR